MQLKIKITKSILLIATVLLFLFSLFYAFVSAHDLYMSYVCETTYSFIYVNKFHDTISIMRLWRIIYFIFCVSYCIAVVAWLCKSRGSKSATRSIVCFDLVFACWVIYILATYSANI